MVNSAIVGVVMGLACALFPTGWSHPTIAKVCNSSSYDSALCEVGKSYMLACITACGSVLMAALAFILAYRQVTLLPWTDGEISCFIHYPYHYSLSL